MKIKNERKNLFIPLSLIVLSIGIMGVLTYAYFYNANTQNDSAINTRDTNTDEPKSTESDTQQSENLQQNPDNKDTSPNTDQPAAPTGDNTSDKQQVQLSASVDTSNSTVYIRGGINYPVSGGACYAILNGPSGESIRKDTTLLQNPASTDCRTISVPSTELTLGTWKVKLHYESETYEGTSNEVTFSL